MVKSICNILIYFILATIIFGMIIFMVNGYNLIKDMQIKINELQKDNSNLWENIDALSEDYTLLYYEIYRKDSEYGR